MRTMPRGAPRQAEFGLVFRLSRAASPGLRAAVRHGSARHAGPGANCPTASPDRHRSPSPRQAGEGHRPARPGVRRAGDDRERPRGRRVPRREPRVGRELRGHDAPRSELRVDDEPAAMRRLPGRLQPQGRGRGRPLHDDPHRRPAVRPVPSGQLREERPRAGLRRRFGHSAVRDRRVGLQVQRGRLLDAPLRAQRTGQAAGRPVRGAGLHGRPHGLPSVLALSSSTVTKRAKAASDFALRERSRAALFRPVFVVCSACFSAEHMPATTHTTR